MTMEAKNVLKILLPVDGSECAMRAVRHVVAMRDLMRGPIEVHLLNVQLPVASGAVKMFISQQQLKDYYRDEGLAALKEARAVFEQHGVPCQHHIGVGDLATTIVDYAREKDCGQIVMGTPAQLEMLCSKRAFFIRLNRISPAKVLPIILWSNASGSVARSTNRLSVCASGGMPDRFISPRIAML